MSFMTLAPFVTPERRRRSAQVERDVKSAPPQPALQTACHAPPSEIVLWKQRLIDHPSGQPPM